MSLETFMKCRGGGVFSEVLVQQRSWLRAKNLFILATIVLWSNRARLLHPLHWTLVCCHTVTLFCPLTHLPLHAALHSRCQYARSWRVIPKEDEEKVTICIIIMVGLNGPTSIVHSEVREYQYGRTGCDTVMHETATMGDLWRRGSGKRTATSYT